jgi:hypothetical protein
VDLDRVAQYARRAPKTFRDFARELSQWLESVSA